MEQNSKEWFQARMGKITASNFHKLAGVKGLGQTGETYIYELIAGTLGAMQEEAFSKSLQWGKDLEDDARMYYELAFNVEVEQVGFFENDLIPECGFSADGIIRGKEIGQEIKCPYNPGVHVKHMLINNAETLLKLHKEYYWQIMFSMYVSGFNKWHFVSYDPRFTGKRRMHVALIKRDEKVMSFIEQRVKEALIFKGKKMQELEISQTHSKNINHV